jgi:uncharacterized protein YaaW (UPF0174 family)
MATHSDDQSLRTMAILGALMAFAIGLVRFLICCTGCALAGWSGTLIAWRVLPVLGASAVVVIERAIVRGPGGAR